MTPPFVLCDKGDVTLFESVDDLERYVETPDIASYRVFDASGQVFRLTSAQPSSTQKGGFGLVSVSRVSVSESQVNDGAALEVLLRDFLQRATGRSFDRSALPDLLAALRATIGFTR